MSKTLQLEATTRTDMGKAASRRLRHADKIPAIVYGADKAPQLITLDQKKVMKALENENFFTQILTLKIEGKTEQVILKDLQRHVCKPKILHMDLQRIKATEKVTMNIPLHFVGEDTAPGIKQGGVLSRAVSEVEVRCLPADLPTFIEVDIAKMELNDVIHLSDLKLSKGIELLALAQGEEYDQPVVTLHMARIAEEAPVEEEAVTEEEAAPTEEPTETESKE